MKTSISWKMGQTIILVVLAYVLAATQPPVLAQQSQPLMFIENMGQFSVPDSGEEIRFQVQANRVYISSGFVPGLVTVVGDHANLCADAFTKIASLEDEAPAEDSDQIDVEIWENKEDISQPTSDVNGDGVVNILDLALVASRFGTSDLTVDLNADSQVDILDLVIVATNYNQQEPVN